MNLNLGRSCATGNTNTVSDLFATSSSRDHMVTVLDVSTTKNATTRLVARNQSQWEYWKIPGSENRPGVEFMLYLWSDGYVDYVRGWEAPVARILESRADKRGKRGAAYTCCDALPYGTRTLTQVLFRHERCLFSHLDKRPLLEDVYV